MNILIKKLVEGIKVEKTYSELQENKFSHSKNIDDISNMLDNAYDFKKDFLEFKSFLDLIKSITSNTTFSKDKFLKDNSDFINAFDSLLSEENYDELNILLNKIKVRLDNYTENLKIDFVNFFEILQNEFHNIENLSAISDLKIKYNEIGIELFKYQKHLIDFLSKKMISIQEIIKTGSIGYFKNMLVDERDFFNGLVIFFEKAREISDISSLRKKYKLSDKTVNFLLEMITNQETSINSIDMDVLKEIEQFKIFKENLIITIRE